MVGFALLCLYFILRDVVPINKVWERIQKIAILKQLPINYKAKRKKGVGRSRPTLPLVIPLIVFCYW